MLGARRRRPKLLPAHVLTLAQDKMAHPKIPLDSSSSSSYKECMKTRAWWFAVLALTGCVSTDPAAWRYQPDTQTPTRMAIEECQNQQRAVFYPYLAFGGAIAPMLGIAAANRAYAACMKAQGYEKE